MADRLKASGMVLAGVSAALAAWTKNEGLLFVLLLPIAMKFKRQTVSRFAMGASGILAVLVMFKVSLAGPNYLAQSRGAILLQDVTDPSRYLSIAAGFGYALIHFGGQRLNPLIPLAAMLFPPRARAKPGARGAVVVLAGMCAGFFLAYLITPFDLAWHIEWSLDRLLLQLWPSALFTCFYTADLPVGRDRSRQGVEKLNQGPLPGGRGSVSSPESATLF
jgi:hypothetical protein